MDAACSDLLAEVRAFRQRYPEVRYVDLISLDIPGHFYGKRYPVDMLEKVAAGSAQTAAELRVAGRAGRSVQDRRLLLQRRRPGRLRRLVPARSSR
jgi:glutamine synthetase